MLLNEIDTLLFDLDGTLVDSAPDLAASVNFALSRLEKPERTLNEIRNWIGNGVDRLLHRAITGQPDGHADESRFLQAKEAFFSWYGDHFADHSRLYPGVLTTLETLHSTGYKLACVTNKPEQFTHPLLAHFQIDQLFGAVVGGDTTAARKPDAEPLLHALRKLSSQAARSVMVGDSINDFRAAENADMGCVMVTWGYHQQHDPAALGAQTIINNFNELPGLLSDPQSGLQITGRLDP